MFLLILYVETSNFTILIGDVELGPRPELLDRAIRPFSFGFAYVTDERQTAVVNEASGIRLDWSRWVSEVLSGTAGNATYTVRRTQLDESGNTVGTAQVLAPSEPPERIVVKFNPERNEYYVEITSVIARAGAEDPDRAIYEVEACVPQPDGSEECFKSNITVYAIDIDIVPLPLGTQSSTVGTLILP